MVSARQFRAQEIWSDVYKPCIHLLTTCNRSIHPVATHHYLGKPIGAILGGLWARFVLSAGGLGSVDEGLRAAECCKNMKRLFKFLFASGDILRDQ